MAMVERLERRQPFRNVDDIQGEMNRLLDSFFGRPATVAAGERQWAPLADIYETKEDLFVDGVLEIRLPKVEAVKPKEIKIDLA